MTGGGVNKRVVFDTNFSRQSDKDNTRKAEREFEFELKEKF